MTQSNFSASSSSFSNMSRRKALGWMGSALIAGLSTQNGLAKKRAKHIVVAGGGIGGLCCAYELSKRGHEVTVLEASNRAGGHVRSIHDPFPDGLYADLGAEQCTRPGYELYRQYAKEFKLTLLPYRRRDGFVRFIGGQRYSEGDLQSSKALEGFGFNQRETDFLKRHDWSDLPLLYYSRYFEMFRDEYRPFGIGLDDLDNISATEHLRREKASDAAIRFIGGGSTSALHRLWHTAILHHRKVPLFPRQLFRIKGGNQLMTDAFATRLGTRVKLGCPITRIEQGNSGVTVRFREYGAEKSIEAEYLVNSIPLPVLNRIPITPEWPPEKKWILDNIPYNMQTRIVFQARTRFWRKEGVSINLSIGHPSLYDVWETANEVESDRGILLGSARPGTTPDQALDAFRQHYSGKNIEIDHVLTKDWFRDPWAPLCERESFRVGQLKKFWPTVIEPQGRIHFVGAYADNLEWGMEAATRSANRVARLLDQA